MSDYEANLLEAVRELRQAQVLVQKREFELSHFCKGVRDFIYANNSTDRWFSHKDHRWIERIQFLYGENGFKVDIYCDFGGSISLDHYLFVPVEAMKLYLANDVEAACKLVTRVEFDSNSTWYNPSMRDSFLFVPEV